MKESDQIAHHNKLQLIQLQELSIRNSNFKVTKLQFYNDYIIYASMFVLRNLLQTLHNLYYVK